MKFNAQEIEGLRLIETNPFLDQRGEFVKVFHQDTLQLEGIEFNIQEIFFSTSKKGVIRGMHYQSPPHDHAKIVFVTEGVIQDVVLDLRTSSPTYGKFAEFTLSKENRKCLYIPKGFAHGFCSLEEDSCVFYLQDSMHHPASDSGVLYNSFEANWQAETPVISARDLALPKFQEIDSPF